MSKERMNDLLDTLQAHGWKIENADEIHSIDNELINWKLINKESVLELEFYVIGDMGQKSKALTDILYCCAKGHGIKLYFDKRKSNEWKRNVQQFVWSLQAAKRIPPA